MNANPIPARGLSLWVLTSPDYGFDEFDPNVYYKGICTSACIEQTVRNWKVADEIAETWLSRQRCTAFVVQACKETRFFVPCTVS